jgi:hypothetical protein
MHGIRRVYEHLGLTFCTLPAAFGTVHPNQRHQSTMASHTATKVHVPGLGMTLGAIQMGVLVSSVLWGVTCVQMYLYSMSPKNDRLGIRSFVAFIL